MQWRAECDKTDRPPHLAEMAYCAMWRWQLRESHLKEQKLGSSLFVGLTDEATQKVRSPLKGLSDLNTRPAVLQRTSKVKGHHTEFKNDTLVLCLCSQHEL